MNPSGVSWTLLQLAVYNFNTLSPLGYPWRYALDKQPCVTLKGKLEPKFEMER